jgi:hypothetical protein
MERTREGVAAKTKPPSMVVSAQASANGEKPLTAWLIASAMSDEENNARESPGPGGLGLAAEDCLWEAEVLPPDAADEPGREVVPLTGMKENFSREANSKFCSYEY